MGNALKKIHPPDYTSSLQYLHKALTIEPGNHEALMHAGWAYFVTGVIEKAKPYFEKCTDSGFAHAAFQSLANIALLQHDETTAKQLYKKGYALFTNKDDFFTTSTEDYQYLQPAGIDKEHFMSLLREAGKQDT